MSTTTIRSLLVTMILGLLLGLSSACSSDDSGGDGESNGTGNDASTPATSRTTRPAATPTSSDAGDDGAPTFAEGGWTGGEAEVRVTGSDTRTITGSLSTESSTDGGTTRLIYTADLDTINFSISTEYQPFDMSASQGGTFSVRIPFGNAPCEVTYQETSDTRIEGTFRCEEAEIEIGPNQGPASMQGSFTATR